ncbi:unnamed protein product, partial [Bubo scandiacus]
HDSARTAGTWPRRAAARTDASRRVRCVTLNRCARSHTRSTSLLCARHAAVLRVFATPFTVPAPLPRDSQ